jgi:GNAT superfamily N-acetyltransferase
VDAEELHVAQAARWRAVDPLLPAPGPPQAEPLTVVDGAGWVRRTVLDPAGVSATWTALHNHVLTAHVAGPDPAAALGALIDRWEQLGFGPPDDPESVAEVVWPSRDVAPVLALARHGFAPAVAVAVGRPGRAVAPDVPGLEVRPVESDADVAVAAAFGLEIVRYDAQFGALGERPSTAARLAESFTDAARREVPTTWLAVLDGQPVGMCAVDPPEYAAGTRALCAESAVGYLGSMFVDPSARGTGVGAVLHAHADGALKAAGAELTLLHHAVPNPRSTPFWYRQGYRPLWTHWQRRPAVRYPRGI